MKKAKKYLALLLALSMAASLAACGGGSDTPSDGGTGDGGSQSTGAEASGTSHYINEDGLVEVNLQNTENMQNMNIMKTAHGGTYIFANMCYDALYFSDMSGNCTPNIATGYDVNEDGTEVTLHIAEGVKFWDGSDCNADDIAYQMQYIADNKTELAVLSPHWKFLTGAEKVDDYTVKIYLSEPFFGLETALGYTWVVSKEDLETYGSDEMFTEVDRINGTGRWIVEDWVDGQYLKFTRNYEYWADKDFSNVDVIYYWFVSEPNAQIAAFVNGDIDMIDGVNVDLRHMLDPVSDQCVIEDNLTETIYYLQFKMDGKAPTSDQNLRYAIMHSIDKDAILSLTGGGKVMTDYFTENTEGHQDSIPGITYDPELAKEYLAKSNYNGEELVFISRPDFNYAEPIVTAIADYMSQIGINTKVEMLDTAGLNSRRAEGTYDMFMVNQAVWDGTAITQNLVPRIVDDIQSHGYVNEELNDLIMSAYADMDKTSRVETLEKVGDILYELQGPIVPFIQTNKIDCIRNGIVGLIDKPVSGGYFYFNISVDEAYL